MVNINVLAILGDAVFSLYIREKLMLLGINNADKLQKKSIEFVSAKSQANILLKLLDDNILTEEEKEIVKRGRNNRSSKHPPNTDIITYKLSTGFEALIGELYINNKIRLEQILSMIEVK